jgi:hypothetical protein
MATHKSDLLNWIDEAAYEDGAEIAIEAARGAASYQKRHSFGCFG